MSERKMFIILGVAVIAIIAVLLLQNSKGTSSIVGTWVVTGHDTGEEIISPEEIGDVYGENSRRWSNATLTFTASGNLTFVMPAYEGMSENRYGYTVQDGFIEIFDPDDKSDYELLEYKNGKIYIEFLTGTITIFEKK